MKRKLRNTSKLTPLQPQSVTAEVVRLGDQMAYANDLLAAQRGEIAGLKHNKKLLEIKNYELQHTVDCQRKSLEKLNMNIKLALQTLGDPLVPIPIGKPTLWKLKGKR